MYIHIYIYICTYIYIYVSVHIYIYTYIYVHIYLSIYLSLYLSIYLSIYLSLYLYAGLDTCGPEGRRHNDLMPSSAKLMAATCIKRSDVWNGASSRVRRPTLDGRTDSPS